MLTNIFEASLVIFLKIFTKIDNFFVFKTNLQFYHDFFQV